MHLLSRFGWLLACSTAALAQSQHVSDELSFGQNAKISPNMRAIPNFHLMGEPNPPQILSNKIILTPLAPGNQRGAAWAEKTLEFSKWTAAVDWRASGQERGGGNLQIWLVKDGQRQVGTASVYTVGKFDGLVLVIDQYAGSGGMIRGFLNDGVTDYKSHHSVDSLAFGHCQYAYRNQGRPAQIILEQDWHNFKVTVDGGLCFESPNIRIPTGYYFGVSAASADIPDSFEVFKLIVTTDTAEGGSPYKMGEHPQEVLHREMLENQEKQRSERKIQHEPLFVNKKPGDDLPDQEADVIEEIDHFADLHYRLQHLHRNLNRFHDSVHNNEKNAVARHEDLKQARHDQLNAMERRLESMERTLHDLQRDVHDKDYRGSLDALSDTVREGHSTLLSGVGQIGHTVKSSAPRLSSIIFVILGSQALLAVVYIIYKRRRAMNPKKYL